MLIESLINTMAKYYIWQALQNIQRDVNYNAKHALYSRHKLFGHGVKKYVVDTDTTLFVQQMFGE